MTLLNNWLAEVIERLSNWLSLAHTPWPSAPLGAPHGCALPRPFSIPRGLAHVTLTSLLAFSCGLCVGNRGTLVPEVWCLCLKVVWY